MDRVNRWGPQTRYRLLRSCGIWLTLIVTGGLLANFSGAEGWRAFGLGLVIPGGGFLVGWFGVAALALFAFSLGLFAVSIFAWFATGMAIAPPLAWLGLAGAAGLTASPMSGSWIAAALPIVAACVALGLIVLVVRNRNTKAAPPIPSYPRSEPTKAGIPEPVDSEDLARLRFIFDRALQPVEQYEGFQWVDQFLPAGVRYQLNFAGYALALTQAKMPAFRGYLHEAQRRLIEKQRDWSIWKYWRLEEAWGNLRLNADPIINDNIMYSGFVGAQIGLFEAATGDRQFSDPGAFTLRTPRGGVFAHDFNTMTDALMRGWRSGPYTLMPCEPNWVYPMCNAIGAAAVITRDRHNDEALWPEIEARFAEGLETELTTPSGRFVAFRSTLTGLAPPPIGGVAADATPALFYNSSFPNIARRVWSAGRQDMLTASGVANKKHFWRIDTGDYSFSRAGSCSAVAAAAVELGDLEVARAALDLLDEGSPATTTSGVRQRENASVFAHFVEVMARQGGTDALRNLVRGGLRHPDGPILDVMDYPNTLVAKADWQDSALHAVLVPGGEAGARPIPIANLRPNSSVTVEGAVSMTAEADAEGRLTLDVPLDGPTPLIVRQAA